MWYLNPKNWILCIVTLAVITAIVVIGVQKSTIADQRLKIAAQDAEIDRLFTAIAGYEEQKAICEKNLKEIKTASYQMQKVSSQSATIQNRIDELRATLQVNPGTGAASSSVTSAPVATTTQGESHEVSNQDVVALRNDLVRFFHDGLRSVEAGADPGKAAGSVLPRAGGTSVCDPGAAEQVQRP